MNQNVTSVLFIKKEMIHFRSSLIHYVRFVMTGYVSDSEILNERGTLAQSEEVLDNLYRVQALEGYRVFLENELKL